MPLLTPVLLHKSGVQGGQNYIGIFSWWCTDSDTSNACAKTHPVIWFPLRHSIISNDFVSGQWRPWSDCADAQADLGLRCPHMPENTYSHGASQFVNSCDGLMRPFVVTTYIQKILFYMSSLSLKHSNIFIFCIRAVWSGPSLSANRIVGHYRMYQWKAKTYMILCACAGWISKTHLAWPGSYSSGPCCSKLTMSLVNVSLKFWSLNVAYTLIFLLKKNVSSFCICKSYSHFFSKNTCKLDNVITRTVNILTTNELVKLTTLWTTGSRCLESQYNTDNIFSHCYE